MVFIYLFLSGSYVPIYSYHPLHSLSFILIFSSLYQSNRSRLLPHHWNPRFWAQLPVHHLRYISIEIEDMILVLLTSVMTPASHVLDWEEFIGRG